MGANSSIEWTDHTFNPWWGCEKVSPGCAHCYADTFAKRVGHGGNKPRLWGPGSERRMFGDKHWAEPLKWDRAAAEAGTRARVFSASMADVFEDRPELSAPRARLYRLIHDTPDLDWLLLTKRPQNAARLWLVAAEESHADVVAPGYAWLPNIWLGTTVEDQRRADERIPHLLAVPAAVRFLSCEPLLGPVDLGLDCIEVDPDRKPIWLHEREALHPCDYACGQEIVGGVDWVIAGGESGPGARPMHPDWARSLRDQCEAAGVAFHMKQMGSVWARENGLKSKGGDEASMPADLRVMEFPDAAR